MESSDLIFNLLKEIHPSKENTIDYIRELSQFIENENPETLLQKSLLSEKYANLNIFHAKRQIVENYVKNELKFETRKNINPKNEEKIQKIIQFLQDTQDIDIAESTFYFGQIFENNCFQFPDSGFMNFYFFAAGLQHKEANLRVAF